MNERTRVLSVGGSLLAIVVVGLVLAFSLGRHGTPASSRSASPSPSPTDIRTQVEQAYLKQWDVYADALLKLDPTHLADAFAGDALKVVTGQVEQQRASDQPARVRVEHDYFIHIVSHDTATVDDTYINHTVRLDPKTLQPIEKDPNQRVHHSYTLKRVSGIWKVTVIILYR